jgi:hypothetical protein
VKPPEDRPPAEELLPVFFEHWPRLRKVVQPYATKLRCPKDHLLAVVVRDPRGAWAAARSNPSRGWGAVWLDEIADPGALPAWCSCHFSWRLDLTDPPARAALGTTPPGGREPCPVKVGAGHNPAGWSPNQ